MLAMSYAPNTASTARYHRAERMAAHQSMPAAMCMGMGAAASASTILIETGVFTSVSFFVVALLVCSLLLTILVVLISLLLTGLTRLVSFESLVGRANVRLSKTQGD